MSTRIFLLLTLGLGCLAVYLFVSAPPLLNEETSRPARRVPIQALFALVEAENDAARAIWSSDIVDEGQRQGMKFQENWRDADVEAGPLPALFLRETARFLERSQTPLRLYLGSDAPINKANAFGKQQEARFRNVRRTLQPEFFFVSDVGVYTAMFPDEAVVPACLSCHNTHPDSPKKDWQLGEVMGATTWTHPEEAVTLEEALETVAAFRRAVGNAYGRYLEKVATFKKPPTVGEKWPRDGQFLPTQERFLEEYYKRASAKTFEGVLAAARKGTP